MSVSLYKVDYKKISNLSSVDIVFLEKHFTRNDHGTITIDKADFVQMVDGEFSAQELTQFGDLLKAINDALNKNDGAIDIGIF